MSSDHRFDRDLESQAADQPAQVDQILGQYLDRLNGGEVLDRQQILTEHPRLGEEVLRRLEVFTDLDAGPDEVDAEDEEAPLGSLGDYTLRRLIGRGGMGVVYDAWENSMDRRVALKVLPPGVAADERALQRFVREAKTAGQLSHPNVVGVYGMGVRENTPFYAMEFVEGETLAQVLAKFNEAEPDGVTVFGKRDHVGYFAAIANAFADVADGLQHAHSKGVTHRDIKPSNLILDSGSDQGGSFQRRLRILDFGLAHLEGQESLTLSGDFVGTPQYMSPEQARRKKIPVDHRTDVYSLGATMYEAFCRRPPFRGKDHNDTLSQIIERDPVEPRKVNPRVPRDLETIVLKCLRKDVGDRYGTAEALGQELRRFVRGDAIEARPLGGWEKWMRRAWRMRWRLAALAGAALLVLAFGLLALNERQLGLNERQRVRDADDFRYGELVAGAVGSIELGGFAEPFVQINEQRLENTVFRYYFAESASDGEDPTGKRARGALRDLEEARKLLPGRPEAYYHLARGLWLLGRRDEALEAAGSALRLDPASGALRSLKAAIHVQEGKPDLARRELEEALRTDGASSAEPWFRARDAAARRDWAAAAEAFSELLLREGRGKDSYIAAALELRLGRGLAYLEAGDCEKARLDFARAHERWPEALAPAYLIGLSFVREGKRELAAAWFREYQRFTSRGDPEILRFLIDLLQRDFDTVATWVEAMRPGPVRDLWLPVLLLEAGRPEKALEVALRSLDERPGDAAGLALLGLVKSLGPGGAREAEELIDRAYAKEPGNPAVCALAANISAFLGQCAAKEKWCRRLLELDPGSALALEELADALQCQGEPDEAVELLEESRKRHPLGPGAYQLLGFIHLRRRHFDAAEREVRRALELDPEYHNALCTLGLVQHGRGRLAEAATTALRRCWRQSSRMRGVSPRRCQ